MSDRTGYAAIPRAILHDATISRRAKLVYLAISTFADEYNQAYPSHARIGEIIGYSATVVKRGLKELRERELIDWEERARMDEGQTSNLYTLATPRPKRPTPQVKMTYPPRSEVPTNDTRENDHQKNYLSEGETSQFEGSSAEAWTGEPKASTTATHVARQQGKTLAQERALDLQDPIVEQFEAAWSAWPNKESKAKAKAKFIRLAGNTFGKALSLRECIERYGSAYARSGRETRYVPHLVTWLNQERWNDPLPQPEPRRGASSDAQRSAQNMDVLAQIARGEGVDL